MSTVQDSRAADKNEEKRAGALRKRRGSETRKPSKSVHVRYPLDEYAALDKQAAQLGLTVSAFVRLKTNAIAPEGRKARRTSPERRVAAQYLAQLGKIGSNINQFARAANMQQAGLREVDLMLEEMRGLGQLMQRIMRGEA
ncbi:MAG: MobC family plasmid mobilization relaxosome protein [Rhodomicrobium sp.]